MENKRIVIRKAQAADCSQMLELIRELAVYERQPDQVTVSMEEFVTCGFGPSPVWEAFVAEEITASTDEVPAGGERPKSRLVGLSLFYIRYSTWKGRRLYLEDIIVTESMRGQGIGKNLFEQTVQICRERGYSGMVWQALDWNEPALNFYRKYDVDFDPEWINITLEMN